MTSVPTLEAAAFAAWPSERTLDLRGWHLRLDRGHTKRANSANATAHALPLRETDVDAIEDHFRRRGLTPVFRLPAGPPTPEQARDDDDQLVGLFDIATHPDHLRRGEARRLYRALMAWGGRRGADTAFLQVLATNRPVIDLYERLGFRIAYAYHYRVPAS